MIQISFQTLYACQVCWYTTIILAAWEVEARHSQIQGQLGKVSKTISQQNINKRTGNIAHMSLGAFLLLTEYY
jgi:hypothetical protein